jgi:hypothetical protein
VLELPGRRKPQSTTHVGPWPSEHGIARPEQGADAQGDGEEDHDERKTRHEPKDQDQDGEARTEPLSTRVDEPTFVRPSIQ